MNEEMATLLKKDLLLNLLHYYKKCQIRIRFIDDYDLLQITLVKQMTPCTEWIFNQIYKAPLLHLSHNPKWYAAEIASDFRNKANKWIRMQFTGGDVA